MIANVGSKWEAGKLVFYSKTSGNTIATFDPDNDSITIAGFGAAEHQANSAAEDVAGLVADFNSLLAKMQASGLMASE